MLLDAATAATDVGDSDLELAEGNQILAMSPMDANKCSILNDLIANQREKTLDAFHKGKVNIRVATDVATRGLNVPNIDLQMRSVKNIERHVGCYLEQIGAPDAKDVMQAGSLQVTQLIGHVNLSTQEFLATE
ncbi:unnamed protein product [Sphagnum balticum]